MLFRTLVLVTALLEILWPRRLVDFWMGVAAREDDVVLHDWVYTIARIEGVVLLVWALKPRRKKQR